MPQSGTNITIEGTRSMPSIELASPILVASEHSLTSYKSCNAIHEREINKPPAERRTNVRSLIEKHRSFQEKVLNAKVNDFNAKKKSFANACENLCVSYNDCIKMEGDTKQLDNVNNFVKNHVFEVFSAHIVNNPKPLEAEKLVLQSKNIDFKTGTPELDEMLNTMGKRFFQNIDSVVSVNNIYYQCLIQIMDTKKFQNLEDVIVHVNLALKKAGDDSALIGSELIASSKKYLEKFGIVLDSKLNEKLKRIPQSSHENMLSALRVKLAENKRRMRIAENSIAVLQKEKKDLLNILTSYDAENIHKVSLEKRLIAEQQKNKELWDTMGSILEKKMPFVSPNQ